MLQKIISVLLACVCAFTAVKAQKAAVKANALYGATATPNLAFEFGLGSRTSLDVAGGYNWFTFSDNKKLKHYLIQPELRFWFCDRFAGTFLGIHLHAGEFNVNRIGPFTAIENNRHEGYFYGAGIAIGNSWILSNLWGLEAEFGAGYARVRYDRFGCETCAPKTGLGHYDYFGPTRLSISLIYNLW